MTPTYNYYEKTLADFPEVLTLKDLQEILHIGHREAKKLLLSGNILYFKSGNHYKIPKHEVISFLKNPK